MLRGPLISTCRMKAPIQGCDTKAARDGGTEGGLDKHLAPHPTSGCSLLPPPGPAWLLSLPCRAHPQPLFLLGTRRASHCLSLHSRSTSCTFAEQSLPSPTTSTPRNSPPHTHTTLGPTATPSPSFQAERRALVWSARARVKTKSYSNRSEGEGRKEGPTAAEGG